MSILIESYGELSFENTRVISFSIKTEGNVQFRIEHSERIYSLEFEGIGATLRFDSHIVYKTIWSGYLEWTFVTMHDLPKLANLIIREYEGIQNEGIAE